MVFRGIALVACLVGCGRLGFSPSASADGGLDGSPDAPSCMGTFSAPHKLTGPIQSTVDDWFPSLTGDGLELFAHRYESTNGHLFRATRATAGDPFSAWSIVSELAIAGQNEWAPSVSFDGLVIVFSSNVDDAIGDLFMATRADPSMPFSGTRKLTELTKVPRSEEDSFLSPDGLRLVYAANGAGGDLELFETTRPDRISPFSTPIQLAELGSTKNEDSPTLSADGLEIFFTSDKNAATLFDVYTARRTALDQPFSTPVLVPQLSSAFDDFGLRLTADGTTLYFNFEALTSGGRNADVWIATRACK